MFMTSKIVIILSGYQDSNLGPPAPKAGALTGLRYTPKWVVGCLVFNQFQLHPEN